MDKAIAVLIAVTVIAAVILIQIYLSLEKSRTIAQFWLKEMDGSLQGWIAVAEALYSLELVNNELRTKYNELSAKYYGISRKRNYEKVAVVNQIHIIATETIAQYADDRRIAALGHDFSTEFAAFEDMRQEYNNAVSKLCSRLDSKTAELVGKVFRIPTMIKLVDLEIL